jgi:phosphoribosyl-AMP cyclohydrolase
LFYLTQKIEEIKYDCGSWKGIGIFEVRKDATHTGDSHCTLKG